MPDELDHGGDEPGGSYWGVRAGMTLSGLSPPVALLSRAHSVSTLEATVNGDNTWCARIGKPMPNK